MPGLAPGVALFLGSLVVLIVASDRFISATARVGLSMGVSPYIIGATVVAGGTSLPELVSSLLAATPRSRSGTSWDRTSSTPSSSSACRAWWPSFRCPRRSGPSLPVMLLATVLYYFITQDREITRWEGGVLLLLYAVFLLTLLELA